MSAQQIGLFPQAHKQGSRHLNRFDAPAETACWTKPRIRSGMEIVRLSGGREYVAETALPRWSRVSTAEARAHRVARRREEAGKGRWSCGDEAGEHTATVQWSTQRGVDTAE